VGFEWDDEKRRSNLANHGIDFRDAIEALQDGNRIWGFDEEHSDSEERWWTLGMTHETILFVVTTVRAGVVRIISARKATRDEQRAYVESFAR
jgi:uncharacterized DUF497 family protein